VLPVCAETVEQIRGQTTCHSAAASNRSRAVFQARDLRPKAVLCQFVPMVPHMNGCAEHVLHLVRHLKRGRSSIKPCRLRI